MKPTSKQSNNFCEELAKLIKQRTTKIADIRSSIDEAYNKSYAKPDAKKAIQTFLLYKQYIKTILDNSDKEFISTETLEFLNLTENAVKQHKKANELLFDNNEWLSDPLQFSANEFEVHWNVNELQDGIDLPCKSMLDRLVIDHKNKIIKLIDIKTTYSDEAFSKNVNKYVRQLSFYWLAVTCFFKHEYPDKDINDYKAETYIIQIYTDNSFCVKVLSIPDSYLFEEFNKLKDLFENIYWHFTNNLWEYSREYYEGSGIEIFNYDRYK